MCISQSKFRISYSKYKFRALTSFLVTQVVINSFRVLGCDFRMVFTKQYYIN